MARWIMLSLRGSIWYYRRTIPLRLRPLLQGRREIWRSMRTSDRDEARLLSLQVGQEVERQFQKLRKQAGAVLAPPITFTTDDLDLASDKLPVNDTLTSALDRAELRDIELDALARTLDDPRRRKVEPAEEAVGSLLAAYLIERELPSKSEAEFRAVYKRFVAIVGEHTEAKDVTKAQCREFKAGLLASSLAHASVKKQLGIMATIWRHARSQGLIEVNLWDGVSRLARTDDAHAVKRLPYDASDLKAIFGGDAFAKLTGAKRWVPLIALYSAGRLEEIHGLRVQDVREVEGIWCFDLTPHDARRLKTASSRRLIPVHPELIKAGLLEYVSRQGEGLLFPVRVGPHGKLSGAFSKWWRRYTVSVGVKDKQKVFHSLRHLAADRLRASGTAEGVISTILRHTSPGMTSRYGSGWSMKTLAEAVASIRYEI